MRRDQQGFTTFACVCGRRYGLDYAAAEAHWARVGRRWGWRWLFHLALRFQRFAFRGMHR